MKDNKIEIARVKAHTRKYKTKKGIKETKPTKTIALGTESIFNDGDIVYIIGEDEFNKIKDNSVDNKELDKLQTELKNCSMQCNAMHEKFTAQFNALQGIKEDNKKLQQQNQELRETNKLLLDNLNKANDNKDALYNSLLIAKDKLNHSQLLLSKYESLSLFERVFRYNSIKKNADTETLEITKHK